ncbi:MAG: putative DNA-binding domain-containing protein [Planctomycetes bacterium]|nr:putative DNA-binding domain-containing protein [Planctomycetota bacterium]
MRRAGPARTGERRGGRVAARAARGRDGVLGRAPEAQRGRTATARTAERTLASPVSSPRSSTPGAAPPASLARLERWMMEVVSSPGGVQGGLASAGARRLGPGDPDALERVVLPSRSLSAADRLAVYADMYFLRFIEVLAGEFPTVRHVLGAEPFTRFVTDYVSAHPSASYTLSLLGAGFPAFLRNEARGLPRRAFLAELALVERAMEEVFDAPRADPLPADAVLALPPDRWAAAQLRMTPALRLFALHYPLNDFMTAVRQGRETQPPRARPTWTAVYRKDYLVWRLPLAREGFALLSALAEGKTLGEALEAAASAPDADPEWILGMLPGWFREWTAEGFFVGVE